MLRDVLPSLVDGWKPKIGVEDRDFSVGGVKIYPFAVPQLDNVTKRVIAQLLK